MRTQTAILLSLCVVALVGCEETNTVNNNPTGPSPAGPANNSAVTAQAAGVCATLPCIASFSVTLQAGDVVAWVFTAGNPSTASSASGDVRFPFVDAYNWTSNVCNSAGSCTQGQGVVTFTAS